MTKYAFIFGGIAGLIVICSMIIGYQASGGQGVGASQVLGFLIMFVALSLIFFGIRRYRDQEQGGVIRFGSAFKLGLAIACVAAIIYVIVWEIYLSATDHAFIQQYTAGVLERKAAAGASADELATLSAQMDVMTERYANPLYRLLMTFTEIFPVGALIALISAFILRRPKGKQAV